MSLGDGLYNCEKRLCKNKSTHYCGQCEMKICFKEHLGPHADHELVVVIA